MHAVAMREIVELEPVGVRSWRTVLGCIVAMIACLPEPVRATPHPLCPGVCDDGAACGAPSDCPGGGECIFEDSCWPGLAPLVREVLPAYGGGVGDPTTGWDCRAAECVPVADALIVRAREGRSGTATKLVSVPAGRRYVLLARVSVEVGAEASISASTPTGDVRRRAIVGPRSTSLFSAEFDVPPGVSGRMELRLDVTGPGSVTFADAYLVVLREHGVWLRFRTADVGAPLHLAGTDLWREDPDGRLRHHSVCASDYVGDQPCLSLGRFGVTVSDGVSPWLDWAELVGGSSVARVKVEVVGGPSAGPVAVDLAFAPDEAAIVYSGETDGTADAFVIALPESGADAEALVHGAGFPADAIARDLEALGGSAAPPMRYGLATMPVVASGGDGREDLGARHNDLALALGHTLGLTVFDFTPDLAEAESRADLLQSSTWLIDLSKWPDALGIGADGVFPDWDEGAVESALAAWIDAHPTLEAALETRGDRELVVRLGPVRLLPWQGPGWRARVRDGLRAAGVDPASLDVDDLDDVVPLEGQRALLLPADRPLRQESAAARLFARTLPIATEAAALTYRHLGEMLRARGVDAVEVAVASPLDANAAGFGAGPSLYAFAEESRVDIATFDVADGAGAPRCRAWTLPAFSAWARAHTAAAIERATFTGVPFDLGASLRPAAGGAARSLALQLGMHGFRRLEHRGYGPAPFGEPGAFGGRGPSSLAELGLVTELGGDFDVVLRGLDGAAVGHSAVAIFAGASDPRWVDLPAITREEIGWYNMLSHAGWPVDVIAESEIAIGLLDRPDRVRSVLVLLRRHVSREAWGVIERWVEGGGHLVTGADLPVFDEAGQLVLSRASWFGIDVGTLTPPESGTTSIQWETTTGSVTFQVAVPTRELFGLSGGPIAWADHERPVALRFSRGRGRVVVSGVALGEAYMAPVDACVTATEEGGDGRAEVAGWSDAIRAAGESVVRAAGLRTDSVVKSGGVILRAFGTTQKPLLAVLTHDPRPRSFVFESTALQRCSGVIDLLGGADAFVNLGSVIASVSGAALFAWDPSACDVPIVTPRPDKPVEQPPDIEVVERGCGAGREDVGLLGGLVLSAAWLAARRRRGLARRRG